MSDYHDYHENLVFQPQEIKSQHELSEQGRQSDVLISAIERCEKLEKQLKIAIKALEEYTSNESYRLCLCYIHKDKKMFASTVAEEAIEQIKELDK